MNSFARRLSAAFLVLLLAGAASAQNEVKIRLVAQPDDPADGLELGETVTPTPLRDRLCIDRWGFVLFTGEVRGSGGTLEQVDAIFLSDTSGDHRAIAVPGEDVPAAGGLDTTGWWVFEVKDAKMSIGGNVAVEARIRNDPFINYALVTEIVGTARTSVAEHMDLPGICRLKRFGDDSFPEDWVLNGETLTFQGQFDKDYCPNMNDHDAVFRRVPGKDIVKLVERHDPVPGVTNGLFGSDFRGPVATEAGAALFYAPYSDGPDYVRALLLDIPDEPELKPVVATAGEVYPDTNAVILDFRDWTIAPPVNAGEDPRTAFIAVVQQGGDEILHVSDTAAAHDPLLSTGDFVDGYEFSATEFTSVGMTLADEGYVVVVGNTIRPGGAEAPAVWRYQNNSTPPIEVLLCEGEMADGLDAGPIELIYTVNVNREGRIAAEVQYQGKQTIIMQDPEWDEFRVAVKQGDQVPARTGTVELVGLMTSFPSDPKLTGPGLDGRQSRFNEQGEFVFIGRAVFPGGGIRSGVYTVSLGERVGCDVKLKVKGGNLVITNGDCAAEVYVQSKENGSFLVMPGANTTLNGEWKNWEGDVPGSVSISMGGGDDRVVLSSSASQSDVQRNLTIDGGPGDDEIEIKNHLIVGNLTVRTGSGDEDSVQIRGTGIGGSLKLLGGDGESNLTLTDSKVWGKTTIKGGQGDDGDIDVTGCDFGKTLIRGGARDDLIAIEDCLFEGPLKIDPGAGAKDTVELSDVHLTNGGLTVTAKKSTEPDIDLEELEIDRGSVSLATGKGGCDVGVVSCSVQGSLTVKAGGSGGPGHENRIDVEDCDFGIWLSVKGKGSHDVSVKTCTSAMKGIAINTKGGTLDLVEVQDCQVAKGLLQVKSKAASFLGEFLRNEVQDGILTVKTGKGNDNVVLGDCTTSGIVQVIVSQGDDEVHVNGMTVGGDLRLGGSHGHDRLFLGDTAPNSVAGTTKADSFEERHPPPP